MALSKNHFPGQARSSEASPWTEPWHWSVSTMISGILYRVMVELREAAGRICLANIQPAFNCYTFFQLCLMLFPNTFDHGRVGWAKCHFLSNLWPRKAQVEARLPGCLLQRCYSYLVRVYERSCPVSIILRHPLTPQWRGQNSPPTWQIMESLMEPKECHHLSVATVFHHDLSTEVSRQATDRAGMTALLWAAKDGRSNEASHGGKIMENQCGNGSADLGSGSIKKWIHNDPYNVDISKQYILFIFIHSYIVSLCIYFMLKHI